MKNTLFTRLIAALLIVATLATSCATPRKVVYLQNIDSRPHIEALHDYESTIRCDDLLEIIVSAPNREVVAPYNLSLSENLSVANTIPYLVDATGHIDFPVLGRIRVEGMTRRALTEFLTGRISLDVRDPIVNVSFVNFRVTVLGEVRSPGTFTLPSEKTNIFQALSLAGDLTLSARRHNVLLVRETPTGYDHVRIDLRSTDLLTSPYYYVSQNDLIYVTPSTGRIQSGTTSTTVLSIISSALSVAGVATSLYLLLRR